MNDGFSGRDDAFRGFSVWTRASSAITLKRLSGSWQEVKARKSVSWSLSHSAAAAGGGSDRESLCHLAVVRDVKGSQGMSIVTARDGELGVTAKCPVETKRGEVLLLLSCVSTTSVSPPSGNWTGTESTLFIPRGRFTLQPSRNKGIKEKRNML